MALLDLLDKTVTLRISAGITTAIASPPPCAVAPADWRTVAEYAQQGVTAAFLIYSAVDLGVAGGDQVMVDGTTYPVVAVRSFSNAMIGPSVFVTVCGPVA